MALTGPRHLGSGCESRDARPDISCAPPPTAVPSDAHLVAEDLKTGSTRPQTGPEVGRGACRDLGPSWTPGACRRTDPAGSQSQGRDRPGEPPPCWPAGAQGPDGGSCGARRQEELETGEGSCGQCGHGSPGPSPRSPLRDGPGVVPGPPSPPSPSLHRPVGPCCGDQCQGPGCCRTDRFPGSTRHASGPERDGHVVLGAADLPQPLGPTRHRAAALGAAGRADREGRPRTRPVPPSTVLTCRLQSGLHAGPESAHLGLRGRLALLGSVSLGRQKVLLFRRSLGTHLPSGPCLEPPVPTGAGPLEPPPPPRQHSTVRAGSGSEPGRRVLAQSMPPVTTTAAIGRQPGTGCPPKGAPVLCVRGTQSAL